MYNNCKRCKHYERYYRLIGGKYIKTNYFVCRLAVLDIAATQTCYSYEKINVDDRTEDLERDIREYIDTISALIKEWKNLLDGENI